MEKKTIIITLILFFILPTLSIAQTFEEQKTQYPVSVSEGRRIITGFLPFDNTDDKIFANAMKWAINNVCEKERDNLFEINVNKKAFSFNLTLDYVVSGKTKYLFDCKANIKVIEGKVVYTLYEITYKGSSLLPLSNVSSLDRLTPEKKPKQQEIVNAFQELASKKLNQMFDEIIEDRCANITHWNDINIQRPQKGMNEDECLLAFGKPNSAYEDNNGRFQWSYGLNFILIFKKGILETIIR